MTRIEEIRERVADRMKLDSWQGITRDEAMFLLSHIDHLTAELTAMTADRDVFKESYADRVREHSELESAYLKLYEAADAMKQQLAAKDAEIDRLSASLRRTEDQLIQVADRLSAKCGDGLPRGSGDTLANACVRKIDALETALAATSRGEGGINATG